MSNITVCPITTKIAAKSPLINTASATSFGTHLQDALRTVPDPRRPVQPCVSDDLKGSKPLAGNAAVPNQTTLGTASTASQGDLPTRIPAENALSTATDIATSVPPNGQLRTSSESIGSLSRTPSSLAAVTMTQNQTAIASVRPDPGTRTDDLDTPSPTATRPHSARSRTERLRTDDFSASSQKTNQRTADSDSPTPQTDKPRTETMPSDAPRPVLSPETISAKIAVDSGAVASPVASGILPASTAVTAKPSQTIARARTRHDAKASDGDAPSTKPAGELPSPPSQITAELPPPLETAQPGRNGTPGETHSRVSSASAHAAQSGTVQAGAPKNAGESAGDTASPDTKIAVAEASSFADSNRLEASATTANTPGPQQWEALMASQAPQGPVSAATGPAPVATATAAEPTRYGQGAAEQLTGPVVSLAQGSNGASSMEVSLHPKELGEVRIRLDRDAAGAVRIVVAATEPGTLRSLMAEQTHLHAALDAAAIPATDRQISFELAPHQPDTTTTNTDTGGQTGSQTGSQTGGQGSDQSWRQDREPQPRRLSDRLAQNETQTIPAALLGTRTYRTGVSITA